ncbi:MAG: exodeoxyribonuclease VII small subunit [Alphaproteobacteria bacterium]|nr:exodeoxyribonuclease VII small subunit [Alphaproteobacteria bacterium]
MAEETFEEAMAQLEEIVRALESGQVKLNEAVAKYEKGCALYALCEKKLADAKSRIDKLMVQDGQVVGVEENADITK